MATNLSPIYSHHRRAPGLTLLMGRPPQAALLELAARLALQGPLRVIVGGNRFDAPQLARCVRRHTARVDETLARVALARPFTCYQALTLLAHTAPDMPLLLLDMLDTFYDDNVSGPESVRLARQAAGHLRRLKQQVPVLVTLGATAVPARRVLIQIVQETADHVAVYAPPAAPRQPTLF
jgi:hypothetical protein